MWTIDKQIDFCYGHRVWSQELNSEFCESGDTQCKCRHPHGHQGHIHVFLEGDELTRGMVTDFKHLGWMKNFLDDNFDHKFIIDKNDPWFNKIVGGKIVTIRTVVTKGEKGWPVPGALTSLEHHTKDINAFKTYDDKILPFQDVTIPGTDTVIGHTLDVSELEGPEQEWCEGFFIVDFLPTSENLSKYLYDIASEKMAKIGVKVSRIDWYETPKSRSSYSG